MTFCLTNFAHDVIKNEVTHRIVYTWKISKILQHNTPDASSETLKRNKKIAAPWFWGTNKNIKEGSFFNKKWAVIVKHKNFTSNQQHCCYAWTRGDKNTNIIQWGAKIWHAGERKFCLWGFLTIRLSADGPGGHGLCLYSCIGTTRRDSVWTQSQRTDRETGRKTEQDILLATGWRMWQAKWHRDEQKILRRVQSALDELNWTQLKRGYSLLKAWTNWHFSYFSFHWICQSVLRRDADSNLHNDFSGAMFLMKIQICIIYWSHKNDQKMRSSQTFEHYFTRTEKFKKSFIPYSVNNYQ